MCGYAGWGRMPFRKPILGDWAAGTGSGRLERFRGAGSLCDHLLTSSPAPTRPPIVAVTSLPPSRGGDSDRLRAPNAQIDGEGFHLSPNPDRRLTLPSISAALRPSRLLGGGTLSSSSVM